MENNPGTNDEQKSQSPLGHVEATSEGTYRALGVPDEPGAKNASEAAPARPFREMVEERLQNHPDLWKKRKHQLGDPMMQTALWTIMDVMENRIALKIQKELIAKHLQENKRI